MDRNSELHHYHLELKLIHRLLMLFFDTRAYAWVKEVAECQLCSFFPNYDVA